MPTADHTHVGVPHRCFLCHEHIPGESIFRGYDSNIPGGRGYLDKDGPPLTDWRLCLIAVYPCLASDGSVRVALRDTDPRDGFPHYFGTWQIPDTLGNQHRVKFCRLGDYCHSCEPETTLFLAHKCCWKVAQSTEMVSPFEMLRFAIHTRPFVPKTSKQPRHERLSLQGHNGPMFDHASVLAPLLQSMLALPLEIQHEIIMYLDGTLFLSLLRVKNSFSPLRKRLAGGTALKPTTRRVLADSKTPSHNDIASLYVRFQDIFGQNYLCDIGFNHTEDCESLPITKQTRGIQFALARFGLRAVRVLYEDRSCSAWLGEPASCWIGTVRGRDFGKLCALQDDLRILRLSFDAAEGPLDSPSAYPVMWDVDMSPANIAHDQIRSMVSTIDLPAKVPHYPGWRQCQHLELGKETDYVSGLTFYFSSGSGMVEGIATHGMSPRLVGRPTGVPVHLELSPGELLVSVWINFYNNAHPMVQGDLLWVKTTRQSRCLGRFDLTQPSSLTSEFSSRHWVRISSSHASKITGILVDAFSYLQRNHFVEFGVIEEEEALPSEQGRAPLSPVLEVPDLDETFKRRFHTGRWVYDHTLFSLASLDSVSEIQIRRHDRRCLGMRVVHDDSIVEVLGQWDPDDLASISTIYNARCDRYLEALSIKIAKLEDPHMLPGTYVEDIVVSSDARDQQPGDVIIDCRREGQRLGWWFTRDMDEIKVIEGGGQNSMAITEANAEHPPSFIM